MRRENLVIAAIALPSANALSLTNFQQIPSLPMPQTCKSTYDTQISSCTVSDFQSGCSEACQVVLKSVETKITTSCTGVEAKPDTLLAVIIRGGILPALCPALLKGSTTTISPTSSKGNVQTTRTINTQSTTSTPKGTESTAKSTTATVGLTSSATDAKPTSIPSPQSPDSSKETPSTDAASNGSAQSTVTPPESSTEQAQSGTIPTATGNTDLGGAIAQSPSTAPVSTPTGQSNNRDSGGGSPFDIQSSASHLSSSSLLFPLLMSLWAGIMFGR